MPAFTHLCSKFNISLAHNTLTLYPKKTGEKGLAYRVNQCFQFVGFEIVDVEYDLEAVKIDAFDAVGRPTFVHRNDLDHHLYHEDSFNIDDTHYHMKFSRVLDEQTLDRVLSIFVQFDLVTKQEKTNFLTAYQQANIIALKNFGVKESSPTHATKSSQTLAVDDVDKSSKKQTPEQQIHTKAEDKFLSELDNIRVKAEKLREKAEKLRGKEDKKLKFEKYSSAATHAEELYTELNQAQKNYFKNKNAETYGVFKDRCIEVIQEHRSVLEEHRGWWKNALCNLGAAVAGIGIIYLAAAGYNYYKTQGKHFFFQFNTDSINKIEDFQRAVTIASPAA
jgi:hypothetical protein